MMADKENSIRNEIKNDIKTYLRSKMEEIRLSDKSPDEKFIQIDMLLDTVKFLNNYKENVAILNRYHTNTKYNDER